MHNEAFENWFVCSFIPFVEDKEKAVFLFFDGHGSHLTYKTAGSAMDEQIVLICIPPHTSHALQPLDVSVFKPLKDQWRSILLQWFMQSRMKTAEKAVFPKFLSQSWSKLSPKNAVSGFRATGLWPLNKAAVPEGKLWILKLCML